MGILDFFKNADINQGVAEYKSTHSAVLLDVRTKEEYAEGHIAESKNLPLQEISLITSVIKDKNTPIFVYCRSGGRSKQAYNIIKNLGYVNSKDIGGMMAYRGEIVK